MSDRIHENTVLLVDDDQPIREERSARCIVMLTSFDDQACVE